MARTIRPLVLLLAALPGLCLAAGTVTLAEIDPLLRQRPQLRAFLVSTFDLDPTVAAALRFGSHVKYLGGAHAGPYIIRAKPKAPSGAAALEIVICTDTRFFDPSGKATEDEANAARLEETLAAVMLREAGSRPAIPSCP
jgi:hypothetical protein